jgi:hypothetical protein
MPFAGSSNVAKSAVLALKCYAAQMRTCLEVLLKSAFVPTLFRGDNIHESKYKGVHRTHSNDPSITLGVARSFRRAV